MSQFTLPPSLDDLTGLADQALEAIPAVLRDRVRGVAIQVVEFPDESIEDEMGLDSPFDLLGLYVGVPFGERSVTASAQQVDVIQLYRRPILDYWCDTAEDLADIVRHVLIHEIGHHFGFSDDAMAALEEQAGEGQVDAPPARPG